MSAPPAESLLPVGAIVTRGTPWPLGASVDREGVNVAVFSAHADAIDLCVFDATGENQVACLRLPGRTGDVWHGHVGGAQAGLVYGLRAHGPWHPGDGHRFNPAKLLLDPYAREVVGRFAWGPEHFGADRTDPDRIDSRDNATTACKARVVADAFDWGDDRPPAIPLSDTVLYELHVKGFSALAPHVPASLRGTFAGLGHPTSVAHLRRLGVTAVNLLPVHRRIDEERLAAAGLTNYWGYNTIAFFAPEPRLGSAGSDGRTLRDEFRGMVRALHAAGIEVILDVVYNHTAESDASGPTVSFRGLDNASYYRLLPHDRRGYVNDTGCGNTVDIRHPRVLQLVLDSMRYWVQEMHVDGYRFDLAPVLGRDDEDFDRRAAFFMAVAQDPVLASVKLIAEPWDLGRGGYRVGDFPNGWAEWNDKFRNEMRSFWLGHPSHRGAFARRLCGSADIYQARGRMPAESVNYVVSHDGFTLRDLVSYRERHNLANLEDNRDGTANNLGFNGGVEGPTDDAGIAERRGRLQRALLATALLSQGTPMLGAGDECGHSQGGNNNPYCHDSPVTWIDWEHADSALIDFTARVLRLRREFGPFAASWYTGPVGAADAPDIEWLAPDGRTLTGGAWQDPTARALGCLVRRPRHGTAPLLLLINAGITDSDFMLPAGHWTVVLDTRSPTASEDNAAEGGSAFAASSESLLLLTARESGA